MEPTAKKKQIFRGLQQQLQGELLTDDVSRMLYATDASMYEILPLGVVRPKSLQDCLTLVRFAYEFDIPLIPRSAGTSLAGQAVGDALIVDCSRHLTRIIHINPQQRRAVVQAGVVLDQLNLAVAPYGLRFAPDPSTKSRCNIAGVIGNNAWGAHAPRDGSTANHIEQLQCIVSPGEQVYFGPMSPAALDANNTAKFRGRQLTHQVVDTLTRYREALTSGANADTMDGGIINNGGYALPDLAATLTNHTTNRSRDNFNLSRLICGSEGTLALVYQATVRLSSSIPHTYMLCLEFESLHKAMQAVPLIRHSDAAAIELLDHTLLQLAQTKFGGKLPWCKNGIRDGLQGAPAAMLIVEYSADNADSCCQAATHMEHELHRARLCQHITTIPHELNASVWQLRRSALGMLMGMASRKKALTFVEDSAVPVQHLAAFVTEAQNIMRQQGCDAVYYGSVSMGLVHIRPLLDLGDPVDRAKLRPITTAILEALLRYGGTLSAKHGDGRARSPFLQRMLGDELMQAAGEVKAHFDPKNLFNPNNIIRPLPMEHGLRIPTALSQRTSLQTSLHTSLHTQQLVKEIPQDKSQEQRQSILTAVQSCNGAAVCRQLEGSMCPSYQATRDELHVTRGRANVIRQILSLPDTRLSASDTAALQQTLELCIACKACKVECPAGVDMAQAKIRILNLFQRQYGTPFKTRLIAQLDRLCSWASLLPSPVVNWLAQTLLRPLLNLHPQRQLPRMQATRFSLWFSHRTRQSKAVLREQSVILLNDFTTEYFHSATGEAVVELLEAAGFHVLLSPCFDSVRSVLSQGMFQLAKQRLSAIIAWIEQQALPDTYIIGLEPSEWLTLRDEANRVLDFNLPPQLLQRFVLFEEFVQYQHPAFAQLDFSDEPMHIALHLHCHQKSLGKTQDSVNTLSLLPNTSVEVIPSGCCGMAGLFGYETKHFSVSKAIANLSLLPALGQTPKNTVVVTTGFSCHHQIKDLTDIDTVHPAVILRQRLRSQA
ncbi:MAG: FAD-binding protein [Gammaproteobacteria bacterium]|nr:FAD-binding protein [Gammaproteobacteria bacterium]MDH5802974.1 FAD-binding protein [Gammaproteobacteria bacterium]